jgi:hypothetical protein
MQIQQKLVSHLGQIIVSLCTRLQQDQTDGADAASQLKRVTSRLARIETLLTMDTRHKHAVDEAHICGSRICTTRERGRRVRKRPAMGWQTPQRNHLRR